MITIRDYLRESNRKVLIKLMVMKYALGFKETSKDMRLIGIAASKATKSLRETFLLLNAL